MKMNLLGDQSGAPFRWCQPAPIATTQDLSRRADCLDERTGAAHKEQHLCADQAYDASDVREFVSSGGGGYTTHIKINPRKRPPDRAANPRSERTLMGSLIPRGWVVERTIS
jgi:hypothetical protein